jgi:integrase
VYIPSPVGRPWGAGGVRLGPEELWAGWERWHLRRHLAPGTIDQRRRHLGMWLDWIGPRWAAATRCEVATLQWHDVDLMRGVVYVEHGKGGKARFAFLPPEARHLFAAFDGSTGHVFARLDGQAGGVTPAYVGQLVRDALDRADANASMHQLRHACATRAVDGGTPLEVVAELLGHESVETTRIYARLSATKVLEAAAAYWR